LSEIPKIGIAPIRPIPLWKIQPPQSLSVPAPVTVNLGFPIIDMPGCVVTRKSNRENSALVSNDPDGNVVLCQAQYPSYDAMDYTPEELLYTQDTEPQRYPQPPIPAADAPPPKKIEDCPPPGAAEIGTKIEDGRKEIIAYQLIGNKCITQYKKLTTTQQIINAIPTAPQVVSTTGITLIATSAALATPLLLRVVKPIVKQIINKIKKKLGKPVRSLTPSEKRANSYREKRGLPPLKI
jgi:hypothetical protein